jgi:hypothetical protein
MVLSAMVLSATPALAQSEQGPPASPIPSRLRILLTTQVALHSVDMITTARALRLGGAEANPLLAPLSGHPSALVAVGSGLNVLQAYAITKLHRRHPKVAVAWVAILIGAEAFVVTNNVRAAGRLERARAGTR